MTSIGSVAFQQEFASRRIPRVQLLWFLRQGTVHNDDERKVKEALGIHEQFPVEIATLPQIVEDTPMPGLAVGFSRTAYPEDVHFWGVLTDGIRRTTQESPDISWFSTAIPQADTPLESVFERTIGLDNLVVWDAQKGQRAACDRYATRSSPTCCYCVLPVDAIKWREATADAGHYGYVQVIWLSSPDVYWLTTVQVSPDGTLKAIGTRLFDNLQSVGLPSISTMRSLDLPL